MESLYDRISKGTISVDEITASMQRATSEGGQYYKSMEKQSQTMEGLSSTLKDVANAKLGEVFQEVSDKIKEALPKIIEFIEKIDVEKLTEDFENLLPAIAGVTTATIVFGAALKIEKTIETVRKALDGMTVSQYALNLAQNLNPTVLIVTAILTLITVLGTLFLTNEDFRKAVIDGWEKIKEVFHDVWDGIVKFFKETLPKAWDSVVEFFKKIVDWIKDNWQGLLLFIVNPFVGGFKLLYDNCDKFKEFIDNFVQEIIDFFTETIPEFIEEVIDWFKELPYKIGYFIGQLIGHIIKFGQDIWEWITVDLPQIINSIVDWFAELPGRIWEWLVNTVNNIIQWGKDTYEAAKTAVTDTINAVVTWFSELPGKIWEWLKQTVDKVKQWGIDTYESAKESITELIDNITTWFSELPTKIYNIGKDIVTGFIDGIKSMGTWLDEQAKDFFDGFVDGVKDVLGINSPSIVFRQIGMFTDEGFADGIDKGEAKIAKAFKNLKITDKFKKMLPDVQAGITGRLQLATAGIGSSSSTSRIETVRTVNNNTTQRVEIVANPSGIYDVVQTESKRRGKKL